MRVITTATRPDAVINERFIILLKQWINVKYDSLDTRHRAAILANAVHRALDAYLPDLPKDIKAGVRLRLMQSIRFDGRFHVTWDDIFQTCMELDLENAEIAKPLAQWVSERTGQSITAQELGHFAGKRLEDVKAAAVDTVPIVERLHRFPLGALIAAAMTGLLLVALTISWPLWPTLAKGLSHPGEESISGGAAHAIAESGSSRQAVHYTVPYPGKYNELPLELKYTEIDSSALIIKLNERDSLLADPPYFDTILHTAKAYNIHPLLLFAITGQEQGFVPRTHPDAETIANNPFNVFHSWRDYNTTIMDASRIAAKTIINLSKDRPEDEHPLQWINRKYAEDPNWWIGVDRLFRQLHDGQVAQE